MAPDLCKSPQVYALCLKRFSVKRASRKSGTVQSVCSKAFKMAEKSFSGGGGGSRGSSPGSDMDKKENIPYYFWSTRSSKTFKHRLPKL
ncbi:hypothetical protein M378DRAFT_18911 [Amanita muscaria Koide BX008]|uniref:Uncharacterized protein n=1 Tax=Amanita muscaria (strain Koide BX008) TaxID=946122 RepID=A0A0C2WEE4_AMAMK|nr:hypothetical protein M378DRAFT_18911 [Amanita muscaria Koide BX008]